MEESEDNNKLPGNFVCSDSQPPHEDDDQAVRECHENIGLVYDYYQKIHHRNSISNRGMTLVGSVNFGHSFPNAIWVKQPGHMIFDDGDGIIFANFVMCLEVFGYGLTHGVIHLTAGLAYNGQPGALNKSIADVFGSLVKQYLCS
jgi:Zn-dependent metalloprotease